MCQRSRLGSALSTGSTVDRALNARRSGSGGIENAELGRTGDMGVTGKGFAPECCGKSRSAESVTALPLQRWITSSHFAGSMTLYDSTETTFRGCANRATAERQLQKMAASAGEDR